jgi:hypothetical protein
MGFTNFPFGITSFGVPTMGMASIPPTSGRVWFVNSNTGLDGNAGSFAQPLATTARAIVLASAGDVIVWMAGHAEKITAAGSITVNNNGLTFWGLGEGKTAPTFTSTTSTAATFLISAANTVIGGNVNAICNIASQVTFFSVTAANVSIDVTIYDTSATVGLLSDVVATSAAANLTLNIDHVGFTASVLGTSMIILTGVVNGNITVNAYGAWATAVVDFATTACVNIQVQGYFYNYTGALSHDVVDTIAGSTWFVDGFDGVGGYPFSGGSGSAVAAILPAALNVPTANATTNATERDVIGNKTDTELFTPSSTASLVAMVKGILDTADRCAISSVTGVLATGTTIFTIAGGPIELLYICSMCTTGGDATAATLLYTTTPTGLSAVPISTASASVASAPVNATVTYAGTGSAAQAVYSASGTQLLASTVAGSAVIIPPGTIKITVGSGPTTTGTWSHYIKYRAMGPGITVS